MSPTLKKYYDEKYRKLGFYIAQNDKYTEDAPPEISFVVGLEDFTGKKKVKNTYKGPKDMEDKNLPLYLKTKNDIEKHEINRKPGPADGYRIRPDFRCPSQTNIWESNIGRTIKNIFC